LVIIHYYLKNNEYHRPLQLLYYYLIKKNRLFSHLILLIVYTLSPFSKESFLQHTQNHFLFHFADNSIEKYYFFVLLVFRDKILKFDQNKFLIAIFWDIQLVILIISLISVFKIFAIKYIKNYFISLRANWSII
jgi:hypothetical protein